MSDPHNAAASTVLTHRVRANAFARETEWRLVDDRVFWRAVDSGEHGVMALDNVASVRLTVEPGRGGARRLCRIRSRDGSLLLISSMHMGGMLRVEDRAATFAPLVRAVIAQVARRAPSPSFDAGVTPFAWYAVIAGLASLAAGLALMLAKFGADLLTGQLLLGIALVALGLPNLLRWIVANKPRAFDPAAPPV